MRAMVTGARGFVGAYLLAALERDGDEAVGCGGPNDERDGRSLPIDVRDVRSLSNALERIRPNVIFHLAAQSSVPAALRAPLETYDVNAMGTARLAQAVRAYTGEPPRIVFTSTAEVYGPREASEYPLRESLDSRPANPYGASKAAAEAILLGEARSFGLDVVIARAFNHIGPGQDERFVVASMANQLARIAGGAEPQMYVGDLRPARDFLDVRDVVEAYLLLARRGEGAQIYNVCSGRAVTIRDVLRELIGIARVPVEVREDPQRMRSVETPVNVGDPNKLRRHTGWQPQIPLLASLREIYAAALAARGG